MKNENYSIYTLADRPELAGDLGRLHSIGWSKFMLFDETASVYFGELEKLFPHLQFVLLDETGKALAAGNSIPFSWDGTMEDLPAGWDDVLKRGVEEFKQGLTPDTVSAISIVIDPECRGKKLSELMVRSMKELVRSMGMEHMVAPVRPSLKHKYPLIPMDKYAYWTTSRNEPFDPWLRIHARTDAEIMGIAAESMKISGSVKDWESWTGMLFPDTGLYTVPEALVPVSIDKEADRGIYIEPNVWMKHFL